MGISPAKTHITTANANICDYGAYTGCRVNRMKMTVTAATSLVHTVQGSTGSCNFVRCHIGMTTAYTTVGAQPSCYYSSGNGTVKIQEGTVDYNHTGVVAAIKAAIYWAANAPSYDIDKTNLDIDGSGASTAITLAYGTGAITFDADDCYMTLDDTDTSIPAGIYIGGNSTEEFFRNDLHVTGGQTNAYGIFSLNADPGVVRGVYNHIHVEGATNNYSYHRGGTAKITSQFEDIIASSGISGTAGTFIHLHSEADGDFDISGTFQAKGITGITVSADSVIGSIINADRLGSAYTTGVTVTGNIIIMGGSGVALPLGDPTDDYIMKYDSGDGLLKWEADTGGGGGTGGLDENWQWDSTNNWLEPITANTVVDVGTLKSPVVTTNTIMSGRINADWIGATSITGTTISATDITGVNVAFGNKGLSLPIGYPNDNDIIKYDLSTDSLGYEAETGGSGVDNGLSNLQDYITTNVLEVGGLGTTGTVSAGTVSGTLVTGVTAQFENLGVGTPSDAYPLEVTGKDNGRVVASFRPLVNQRNAIGIFNDPSTGYFMQYGVYGNADGFYAGNNSGFVVGEGGLTLLSGSANPIIFATDGSLSAGTNERMRINAIGNVGINSDAPEHELDVKGTISATTVAAETISGITITGNTITLGGSGKALPLDTPADNDVIKYDSGTGLLSFEADAGGSGVDNTLDTLTTYVTDKILTVGGLGTDGTISANIVTGNVISGNTGMFGRVNTDWVVVVLLYP